MTRLKMAVALVAAVGTCLMGTNVARASDASDPTAPGYTTGVSNATCVQLWAGTCDGAQYNSNVYYDHTNITFNVRDDQHADPQIITAIHQAIASWADILRQQFPTISITDISGQPNAKALADVDVVYVPDFHGKTQGGVTHCRGTNGCQIELKSVFPPGGSKPIRSALSVYRVAMHEIGHSLGLGHAAPLNSTNDVMGYGWYGYQTTSGGLSTDPGADYVIDPIDGNRIWITNPPVVSDCDISALKAAFAWVIEGTAPHAPTVYKVNCGP